MVAGAQWGWRLSVTWDRKGQCGTLWVLTPGLSLARSKVSQSKPFTLTCLCTCWTLPGLGPAPERREILPAVCQVLPLTGRPPPPPFPSFRGGWARGHPRAPPTPPPGAHRCTRGPDACTQREDPGPAAPTGSFSGCAGTWRPPRPRPLRPGEPGAPGWASGAAAPACLASPAAPGLCGRPVRPPNPVWAPDPPCLPPQAFPWGSQGTGPEGRAQKHSA